MSKRDDGQTDPYDGTDLGQYRYAVARLLRLLIQARCQQEPEFFDRADRERWKLPPSPSHAFSVVVLLREAEQASSDLYSIVGRNTSMGVVVGDSRSELKEAVIGIMTSLWSCVDGMLTAAKEGKLLDWDEMIPIDTVRTIREGLDQLPHPSGNAKLADGPIPPDKFQWGQKVVTLAPKPWALVNFLWSRRARDGNDGVIYLADFDTIAWEVWREEIVATGRAIPSAASKATLAFEECEMPIRVSIASPNGKTSYAQLIIAQSAD